MRSLQSALLKKAGDTEGDAAEASATKLRLQQQNSMALVPVTDPQTANGSAHPPILRPSAAPVQTVPLLTFFVHTVVGDKSQIGRHFSLKLAVSCYSFVDSYWNFALVYLQEQLALPEPPVSVHERALSNGSVHADGAPAAAAAVAVPLLMEDLVTTPAPAPVSVSKEVDLLGDLLAPLAIEAAPSTMPPDNMAGLEGLGSSAPAPGPASVVQASGPSDPLALALYDNPSSKVQVKPMILMWTVHVLML